MIFQTRKCADLICKSSPSRGDAEALSIDSKFSPRLCVSAVTYCPPGFTLLEVLVAIAILGVSLITLFELFSGGLRLGRVSEDYLKATLFAQKKMNELRLENFTLKEGEESGKFEEDPNYLWTAIVEPFERDLGPEAEDIEKEAEEADKKTDEEKKKEKKKKPMQKVELKVSWKSGGKPKELRLVRLFNPIKWNYHDFMSSKPKEKDTAKGTETGKEKK